MRKLRAFIFPDRKDRAIPLGRTTILVQMIAALLFLVSYYGHLDLPLPLIEKLEGRYELEAMLPDAQGLDESDRPLVRVNGVQAGQVTEVRREDGRAVVTLSMERKARGKIFTDARAYLFAESGLQNLNLAIDSGSSGTPIEEGARIRPAAQPAVVTVDNITRALHADTRAYLQILLRELAVALKDRPGELQSAVEELGPMTDSARQVAAALEDRRRLLARLVTQLDVIFRTTGRRGEQLAQVVANGRRTLEVTGRRDSELAASVREMPALLREMRGALTEVEALSQPLLPTLNRLREPVRALPRGLVGLRQLIPTTRGLLVEAGPLVREGRKPVRDLRTLLTELGPLARASRPGLGRLNALLDPLFDTSFDPAASSIAGLDMLPRFIEGEAGAQSVGDANGVVGRGSNIAVEDPLPENFGLPAETAQDSREMRLVRADLLASLAALCDRDLNRVACLLQRPMVGSFAEEGARP